MERSRALCTPRCSKWKALPPSPPTRWPSGLSSDPAAPGAGIPGPRCCLQSFPYSLHLLKLSWPTLGSLTGSQRGQIRTCPGLLGSVYLPFQPGPNPILVAPGHALPQSVAEKLWLEAKVKPAPGHPLLGPPALGRGRGLDGPSPELCCPQLPRSKAPAGTVFFGTLHSNGYIFPSLLFASLLFSAVCKASSDNLIAFLHFFVLGMVLITASCAMS